MWIQQRRNLDINSEECLRLTSQSPDCFLPYEILNRQYKKFKENRVSCQPDALIRKSSELLPRNIKYSRRFFSRGYKKFYF